MKKLIAVVFMALMMMSLTGCSLFTEKSEVTYSDAKVIDMGPDYDAETVKAYVEAINNN